MYDHLSPLAQTLGRYMAEQSQDGLPMHFGEELLQAFPEETRETLARAAVELEMEGFVTLSYVIGSRLPRIRTTADLFVACDPAITGHDPIEDAVALARLLIDDPTLGGSAQRLEQASGFDRRRFNPALAMLIPYVDDRRVRKVIQADYATAGFVLMDEDVIRLTRFVEQQVR